MSLHNEYMDPTIQERAIEILLAPLNNPEIVPSLLPVILGAVVLELYFGKHTNERLGWNSSVANSVIWLSTGISLLFTESLETPIEMYAVYFVIGLGLVTCYLNFFHKWSADLAFMASSPMVVYLITYVVAVVVKTDIPADETTIKSGIFFVISMGILFSIIKGLEKPSNDIQV